MSPKVTKNQKRKMEWTKHTSTKDFSQLKCMNLSINSNDRKQPFLDHQVSLDHPWFGDHWLNIHHFFWEKLNVPFWNASVTPHYHCKLFCKFCSKNYPWNRISERMSCEESDIFLANFAFIAQLRENQQILKKLKI